MVEAWAEWGATVELGAWISGEHPPLRLSFDVIDGWLLRV